MLATATTKLKAIAPKLGFALRETRDRLTPGRLLLRELIAAEMQAPLPATAGNDSSRLEALVTTSRRDILAAQRLRYRVFTEEYGATFDGFAGIDRDRYDRHCRHVVVKDRLTGQVIAYTRILTGERARKTGGWYSAGEFEMDMVDALPGRVLEIGRTCVHPEYRSGAAIGVLWAQLARILLQEGHRYLIGCASIALSEPGAAPAFFAGATAGRQRPHETAATAAHLPVDGGKGVRSTVLGPGFQLRGRVYPRRRAGDSGALCAPLHGRGHGNCNWR